MPGNQKGHGDFLLQLGYTFLVNRTLLHTPTHTHRHIIGIILDVTCAFWNFRAETDAKRLDPDHTRNEPATSLKAS